MRRAGPDTRSACVVVAGLCAGAPGVEPDPRWFWRPAGCPWPRPTVLSCPKKKPPVRFSCGRCRLVASGGYVAGTVPLIVSSIGWHEEAFRFPCTMAGDQVFTALLR